MIPSTVLGWVVIAYCVLTASSILDVVRMILTRNPENAYVLLDVAIWAALLIGGIAMLHQKTWSKWLVRSASAGSLVAALAAVLAVRWSGYTPPLILLGAQFVPVLLILLGSLFVRFGPTGAAAQPPSPPVDPAAASKRTNLDISYACFLGIDLVIVVFAGLGVLTELTPLDEATSAGLGFFVLIPLTLATLAAAVIGIVLSFVILRDWRLHVLSGLTLLLLLTILALEKSSRVMFGVAIAYMIVSGLFGARWIALRRRQA